MFILIPSSSNRNTLVNTDFIVKIEDHNDEIVIHFHDGSSAIFKMSFDKIRWILNT